MNVSIVDGIMIKLMMYNIACVLSPWNSAKAWLTDSVNTSGKGDIKPLLQIHNISAVDLRYNLMLAYRTNPFKLQKILAEATLLDEQSASDFWLRQRVPGH